MLFRYIANYLTKGAVNFWFDSVLDELIKGDKRTFNPGETQTAGEVINFSHRNGDFASEFIVV